MAKMTNSISKACKTRLFIFVDNASPMESCSKDKASQIQEALQLHTKDCNKILIHVLKRMMHSLML